MTSEVAALAASFAPIPAAFRRPLSLRVLYGDLRTGRIYGECEPSALSWSRKLDDAGRITLTLPGSEVRRAMPYSSMAPAKTFVAVEYGDVIVAAGPVWAHTWSWQTRSLDVGAAGLWSLFDHRKVLPVLEGVKATSVAADTVISGTTLGGIARGLVEQAMQHVGGDLPVVLPDAPTGTRTETIYGYSLAWVGEELRQLTTRETGAPNIRFTPRRAEDRRFVEWVMEFGTEEQPQLVQPGADWVFDTSTPRSPVVGVSVDIDGSRMGSRAWVTGEGTDRKMLVSEADNAVLTDAGYPLLEVEEGRPGVKIQDTLDGHAGALLQRSSRPVEAWNVTVRADGPPRVDQYAEGDYGRVIVAGDDYLPDGQYRRRIVEITGGLDDQVTLAMAETLQGA